MNTPNLDPAQLGELLSHMSESSNDPTVTQFVQLLLQFLADDEEEAPEQRLEKARLRKENRRLLRHVSLLERRNSLVAGAMGACPCWGSDPWCDDCGGDGTPGSRSPAPTAFEALVVPLLHAEREIVLEIAGKDVSTSDTEGAARPAEAVRASPDRASNETPTREDLHSYSAPLEEVWS